MKSLPEKDFWNNIKTRLSNYTEEPEDDWDDIAAIISPSRYDARKWIELSQDIASAVVLVLLLLFTVNTTDTIPARDEIAGINSATDTHKSAEELTRGREPASVNEQKKHHDARTDAENQKIKSETSSGKTGIPVQDSGNSESINTSTAQNTSISNVHKKKYSNNNLYTAKQTTSEKPTDLTIDTQENNDRISTSAESDSKKNADSINANGTTNNQSATRNHSSEIAKEDSAKNTIKTDSIADKETVKKEEQQQKKRAKKFHPAIYFTVSPSLAYQKIVPAKNDAINITELKSDGIFSSNRLGLSIDGGFQIPVTQAIEVYAGLSYYQQNQTITYKYSAGAVEEIEGNPDEDYIIKPGIKQKEFSYAMRNAGISAGFFYRLKTDKLMHKIGAGLQYQKGFLRAGGGDTYSNRSSNYFNYQLLYRLELAVNTRTNFYIQPSFTHAIRASESLQEPFTLKPYRAAIGIGMIYRF
jgi:hypothetical protein